MSQPEPMLTPPLLVPRQENAPSATTLAVVDFEDLRPDYQRGAHAVNEPPTTAGRGARLYWYFAGAPLQDDPPADAVGEHARITGDAAFAWISYPNVGQPARTAPPALGIADYFAAVLLQRGLVERVVRVSSVEEASAVAADLVLSAKLHDFVSVFQQRPAERWRPKDDDQRFELITRVRLEVRLVQGSRTLFEETMAHDGDPENLSVHDHLHLWRETEFRPVLALDQEEMPEATFEDMVRHAQQALEAIARTTLDLIEGLRRPAEPAP
jgi:hypothetical protein